MAETEITLSSDPRSASDLMEVEHERESGRALKKGRLGAGLAGLVTFPTTIENSGRLRSH